MATKNNLQTASRLRPGAALDLTVKTHSAGSSFSCLGRYPRLQRSNQRAAGNGECRLD